jgi:hypothetical protein
VPLPTTKNNKKYQGQFSDDTVTVTFLPYGTSHPVMDIIKDTDVLTYFMTKKKQMER